MQPENEGQKTATGMSKVQGIRDGDSLRGVRRDGLEPGSAGEVREMRGQGLPYVRPPNPLRYYLGAVGVGVGVGIGWTLTLTSGFASRYLTHAQAERILWSFVGVVFTFQTYVLLAEGRRLKREGRVLKEFYDRQDQEFKDFCVANGMDPKRWL